jgi:hypothetical protein
VRLAVEGGPRQLRRLEARVEEALALGVEEEVRLAVDLRQAHAMAGVDLQAAEAAHFGLQHHIATDALAKEADIFFSLSYFFFFLRELPTQRDSQHFPKPQNVQLSSLFDIFHFCLKRCPFRRAKIVKRSCFRTFSILFCQKKCQSCYAEIGRKQNV